MTTRTVAVKVTTSVEPKYTELLRRVRSLFARDVDTKFEMALIFSKMLKIKTAEEIAEDTDMPPGSIMQMARVAEFWGNVRIKPDGAGKRHAPWYLYDRVACDPLIRDDRKEAIKRVAPVKGLSVVRQLIKEARTVSPSQVDAVVNGDQPRRATPQRQSSTRRAPGNSVADVVAVADGIHYAILAVTALDEAIEQLDQLESLGDDDAVIIRSKIDQLVRHIMRLTQIN